MSYILDALRKADAQREGSPARGIHAQPMRAVPVAGGTPWRHRPLAWVGGLGAVGVLAVAAWYLWAGQGGEVAPPLSTPPTVAAVKVLPAPVALPAPVPAPIVVAPVVVAPKLPPPPVVRASAPVLVPAPESAAPATGWPADAPKLAISGAIHSDNPAQRMLIVNGQVFNEGGEPAPGVQIEQIRPRNVVLRFRGQRYIVAY